MECFHLRDQLYANLLENSLSLRRGSYLRREGFIENLR